jgi:hypothetical protein
VGCAGQRGAQVERERGKRGGGSRRRGPCLQLAHWVVRWDQVRVRRACSTAAAAGF